MGVMDIFSLETDTIDISGLDTLVSFSKYQPHNQDDFFTGLILAKDLISHEGVRLYTQDTPLTPDRQDESSRLSTRKSVSGYIASALVIFLGQRSKPV